MERRAPAEADALQDVGLVMTNLNVKPEKRKDSLVASPSPDQNGTAAKAVSTPNLSARTEEHASNVLRYDTTRKYSFLALLLFKFGVEIGLCVIIQYPDLLAAPAKRSRPGHSLYGRFDRLSLPYLVETKIDCMLLTPA